ncbi:amino acid adenylation domain-containing protein [Leptothoe sp. ISB3NOV94-8A]
MKQSTEEFVSYLKDLGIRLQRKGDYLHCNAPKGTLTSTLRTQLAERKVEVLAFMDKFSAVESISSGSQSLPTIVPNESSRYQPFPLNDVQQAYWLGRNDAFELSNISTHAYAEVDIINLDLKRFENILNRIINHHEMMRAIVLPDGRQQIIEEVPAYKIEVLDLSESDPDTRNSHLMRIRDRMSHQVLPIDQYPLFEFRAVKLSKSKTRLYSSIDLMISDAWSFDILKRDFIQLIHHPESSLTPLELSFRDYVLAEISLRKSTLYHRSLAYWRDRLHTLPAAPQLPLAKSLATIDRPRFVHYSKRFEPDTWNRLKRRGYKANLTPSVVVLAAFAEILTAWSKDPRFTINVTLFKRFPLHPQVNKIVGDFTSLALLAVDNSAQSSFEVRAQRIQKQLWNDIDHRYVSGLEVLREIAKLQKRPSAALMPVVYTSTLGNDSIDTEAFMGSLTQTTDLPPSPSNEEMGEIVYSLSQTPQVYLDHQAVEDDGALIVNWDAIKNLFPPNFLDDMFAAYCEFLSRLADEDDLWQEPKRQLLPPTQLKQLTDINATEIAIPEDTLLHTLFFNQVALHRQKAAVITSDRTLTYQELRDRTNQLGHHLRQLGTRSNQLIAVVMEKGWEQVVAVLGIHASGAAYVPIDPALPTERRQHLLREANVQWVITQPKLDASLEWPDNIKRLCIDYTTRHPSSIGPLEPIQKSSDLAYVIYTSGSTGKPKGVMIDHRGAVNTILDINQRFNVTSQDHVFALSSLSFDLSVYDIFGTLAAGGTIVIPDADATKDPAHWIKLMAQQQVSIWNSVPALMQMLMEYAADCPELLSKSLRLVMLSGDWLPLNLPKQIKDICEDIQLVSLGGATEASIWSILYPIEQVDPTWKSIPYGRPMANQSMYVFNDALELCPLWVPGQLYIGGIGLAKGYWQNEEKTNASFIIHPQTKERLYKTGDLGRYLPDGNIEFLGREDFQVKIKGHRIELGEIETNLQQHTAVKEALVAAVGESREDKQLVAYVVPESDKRPNLFEVESKNPSDSHKLWESLVQAGLQKAQHDLWHVDAKIFSHLWKYQDHLYAISVCRALRKLGAYNSAGEKYSLDDLISKCQIAPRYRRWVLRALNVLIAEGWIQQQGEVYESIIGLPTLVSEELSPEVQSELSQSNEFTKVWVDFLDISAAEILPNILTEKIHSGELYANEKLAVDGYQKRFAYCHAIASELAKVLVQNLGPQKQLRILEVGAGYGSCTLHLLPLLPPDQTTYVFTDISNFFLQRAKESFADYPFISYGLLDLEKDPHIQGYESNSFDVVIAASVLHTTRDLEKTLQHVRSLLAPNGLLLLIEETKFHRSFDLHLGLQQGFDVFEDEKLRTKHALLSREQWQTLFAANEFEESVVLNQPGCVADFIGLDVLMSRGPSSVRRFKSVELRNFLQEKLPNYMLPSAFILLDKFPLTPNGKLDRSALPNIQGRGRRPQLRTDYVSPRTKNEKLIVAIWQEILQVDKIGIYDNFFELGGDSLLATRIIAQMRKAFELELPLVIIYESPTVAGISEKIENVTPATTLGSH